MCSIVSTAATISNAPSASRDLSGLEIDWGK